MPRTLSTRSRARAAAAMRCWCDRPSTIHAPSDSADGSIKVLLTVTSSALPHRTIHKFHADQIVVYGSVSVALG